MKKNFKRKKIIISLLLVSVCISLALFFLPLPIQADGLVPCGTKDSANPCTICDLIIGFKNIVDYGYKIAIFVALACLTFAGIMYLVSSGDEGLMTSAKNFIRASLVGFALIFAAWLIINSVLYFLSAKTDLGIGATNWWTFTCTSTPPPPPPPPAEGGSSCSDLGGTCTPPIVNEDLTGYECPSGRTEISGANPKCDLSEAGPPSSICCRN